MSAIINYASEEGLKELYRRAVARIPAVDTELDFDSGNPIANSTVTYALSRLGSYVVVKGTGSDHHPDVAEPSDTVLYFVKVASVAGKDNYKEWIWTDKWECIGEPSITVDTELDFNSDNPIANKTVTEALSRLGSYLVVPGTGADNHPNVAEPSDTVLYFVKVGSAEGKDNYKEWIWTDKWECIGEPSITIVDSVDINSYDPVTSHAVALALANFGGFEKVNGTGPDNHPDVQNPSNKVIYLVEVSGSAEPDHCMEWVWSTATGTPEWVCIGSTTNTPTYATVEGTLSGTTLTVDLMDNKYVKFDVDSTVTDLVVNVPADGPTNVGWFKFEFTLPEDTDLVRVSVLDSAGNECLVFAPMSWPGLVTYQGEVTGKIAKIIGYSPVLPEENILCTDTGANIVTGDRKKIRYRIVD